MLSHDTRAVIEAYAQSHDPQFFAPDAVYTDMARACPVAGREAIAAMLRSVFYETFSDAAVTLHRAAADAGQGIGLVECTFRGRHTGTLLGIQPTFRQVELPMLAIYEVEHGEIRRARQYYDVATLLRQLGREPETGC
jgi:steroid delta-isomerase-like uncharacterized protein